MSVLIIFCIFFNISLGVIFFYDLCQLRVPLWAVVVLGFLAVAFHTMTGWSQVSPGEAWGGAFAGVGLLYLLRFAHVRLHGIEAFGMGDACFMVADGTSCRME